MKFPVIDPDKASRIDLMIESTQELPRLRQDIYRLRRDPMDLDKARDDKVEVLRAKELRRIQKNNESGLGASSSTIKKISRNGSAAAGSHWKLPTRRRKRKSQERPQGREN